MWVEDSGGNFIKTISRWSDVRTQYLLDWLAKAGAADADAVSGASRPNYPGTLKATWDLKNKAGAVIPDGTYTIRIEMADGNSASDTQNHEATFTFVKSANVQQQDTPQTNNGITAIQIDYTNTASCGDGIVEAGETCDPPGSCPTSCPVSVDKCMPSVLMGSAADCTAQCVVEQITDCVGGDGCCASGCTAANDSDCAAEVGGGATGSGDGSVTGGCTTDGDPRGALALSALFGLAVVLRRRR